MITGQLQIEPHGASSRPQSLIALEAQGKWRIEREVHGASSARLAAALGLRLPSLRLHRASQGPSHLCKGWKEMVNDLKLCYDLLTILQKSVEYQKLS